MDELIIKLHTKTDELPSLRVFTQENEQLVRIDLTPNHTHGHFVFVDCSDSQLCKIHHLLSLMGISTQIVGKEKEDSSMNFMELLDHLLS